MRVPFLVGCLLLLGPAAAAGEKPVPLDRVVEGLVRDLGAESYQAREQATEALRRIGRPAQKALEKAAESDDPEVRYRARKVLADVRLGIRPQWPSDIALLVRHYERLNEHERGNALRRVHEALGEEAIPFLVQRLGKGGANEAQQAFYCLQRLDSPEACRQIVEAIEEPANAAQKQALAYAHGRLGSSLRALEVLGDGQADPRARARVTKAGAKELLAKLEARDYEAVAEQAAAFARAAPDDARFLYIQAEALAALGRDEQAAALRKQALALHPDQEGPHYVAGTLLMELGRRRLAAREWQAILEVPPEHGVYDINAHLRLSTLYAQCGIFDRAAKELETAYELFLEAKAEGEGMGIAGGSEEHLRSQIAALRRKAAQYPTPPDAEVEDALGESELRIHVAVRLKDGKLEELRRALGEAQAVLTMSVQPRGLRLFDVAPVTVRYQPEKHQLAVLLGQSACCEPVPFRPRGEKARVAINTLDCCYLFDIETDTGHGEQVARYEKDYVLKVEPGIKIAAFSDVALTLNGTRHEWAKLTGEGVALDVLPETLAVELEGTTPQGRRASASFKVKPREPEIQPIRPEAEE
ncbi:MAG: hypothetical protein ACLF0G_09590 [Candidatus Brocadiia bacterium]